MVDRVDHDGFRDDLLEAMGATYSQWIAYRNEIVDYRNKSAAHLDWNPPRPAHYPIFDMALEAAYHYYAWTHEQHAMLDAGGRHPTDLRKYGKRYFDQCRVMAELAIAATDHVEDRIW